MQRCPTPHQGTCKRCGSFQGWRGGKGDLENCRYLGKNATIPDKTTWESFPHHVHFPTQQNYFQNDAFAGRKPLPPIQCCFPKRPGIRLSFEYTTTLLSGQGGEGRTGTATIFRKKLSKYTIFSTVLSKIVDTLLFSPISCFVDWLLA